MLRTPGHQKNLPAQLFVSEHFIYLLHISVTVTTAAGKEKQGF